jgi:hypothetical protein
VVELPNALALGVVDAPKADLAGVAVGVVEPCAKAEPNAEGVELVPKAEGAGVE